MSPLALARRLVRETQIASTDAARRKDDAAAPTYSRQTPESLDSLLHGIEAIGGSEFASRSVQLYCEHKFDLLGSGWVQVSYGMQCAGLEGTVFQPTVAKIESPDPGALAGIVNESNLREAARLWALLPKSYAPIDWQVDFRSGFRWDARTWYHDIKFGAVRGADIKLPWELSRLQHLPQMALEFSRTKAPELSSEFRSQLIDWLATNPPRFGANWFSTMDVAIRAANMLVANDLFRSYGATFDYDFDFAFRRSIRDHAIHILENLEWSEALRGNHYLANIVGLAFCAAYLPRSDETDSWLSFCDTELRSALGEQFHADGSNFEASTSYHRLSAEMVVYAAAVLKRCASRVSRRKAGEIDFAKIRRMGDFTRAVTKPNGNVWQVGDNDSGRFLKLAPAFSGHSGEDPGENHLDHAHLLDAISAVAGGADQGSKGTDDVVLSHLLGANSKRRPSDSVATGSAGIRTQPDPARGPAASTRVRTIDLPDTSNLRIEWFPDFGVYIFRNDQTFIGIRCGTVGQNGIGGHAHNDQLAIEINVGGEDWIADPGSYVYTPLPDIRNQYRSAAAHSVPHAVGLEPGGLDAGLFRLAAPWTAHCLAFDSTGFSGEIRKGARIIRRDLTVTSTGLTVTDSSWGCELAPEDPAPPAFSPGYGIKESGGPA